MSIDKAHLERILENLDKINKACQVIDSGITAEKEDVAALIEYRSQLLEATDNLRDRIAQLQAISIREYKRIKEESKLITEIISKKESSIKNLEAYLKEEKRKEVTLKTELDRLWAVANRKTVVAFKGKK